MGEMIVDTNKLRYYAEKIQSANSRLSKLDQRLNQLYGNAGLLGVWQLIQMGSISGVRWELQKVSGYLYETATSWETVENRLNQIDPSHCYLTNHSFVSKLFGDMYLPGFTLTSHEFFGFFEDRINDYIEILKSSDDPKEKFDATVKWLKSISGDISTLKDYVEGFGGIDVKFPSPIKDGMDFIKALDSYNKFISGTADYVTGMQTDDTALMTDGAKNIFSFISSQVKVALKKDDNLFDTGAGILISYGTNMVSNWLDSIQTETEASEVYWNTFANSALDVFHDEVCNNTTLAIAYLPAKGIAGVFGFDLTAEYEKLSDKKGFAAVTDSVNQLHDLIIENSTWENWKSGFNIMIDGIKGWFD